jgi:hypothetical protein
VKYRGTRSVMLACASGILVLAACGSGSSHATPTTGAVASTTAGGSPVGEGASGPGTSHTGPAVSFTDHGYEYRVAMNRPGVTSAPSVTTDDGSGDGSGTAIDATPGNTLVVATLTITNPTDRPEPLAFAPTGSLPDDLGVIAEFVAPRADAPAFGLHVTDQQSAIGGSTAEHFCGDANGTDAAPSGYCNLGSEIVAYSPASTDLTQPPQLSPGASGTITLAIQTVNGFSNGNITPSPIAEHAPISSVRLAIETTSGDSTSWTELS